jgi:hypothetical protein
MCKIGGGKPRSLCGAIISAFGGQYGLATCPQPREFPGRPWAIQLFRTAYKHNTPLPDLASFSTGKSTQDIRNSHATRPQTGARGSGGIGGPMPGTRGGQLPRKRGLSDGSKNKKGN